MTAPIRLIVLDDQHAIVELPDTIASWRRHEIQQAVDAWWMVRRGPLVVGATTVQSEDRRHWPTLPPAAVPS